MGNPVSDRRLRVLTIASHPVQYSSPVFRLMAKHPRLDFHVAYCSLRGAEAAHDPEFGRTVQWDVPLLDGYSWTHVQNRGSGSESFFGLYNPGLWTLIRQGRFDAVVCHTGYLRATFWLAYFAARSVGAAFLFGTDATTLESRDHREWKRLAKRAAWPLLFRLPDQVVVPSSGTRDLMLSLGIHPDRITLTPYSVDNDWWTAQSAKVDRDAVRASWGATSAHTVVLFCAKLQPWKRPLDLLRAFAEAKLVDGLLVFAGDGPLRRELEAEAANLGVASRVRFLGFVNQSQLPEVYASADVMVLPSEYEPFAVVVNEAMCCGCPVIASDGVGAASDLVTHDRTGFEYSCGDLQALRGILATALTDGARLREMGRAARQRMESWSPTQNVESTVQAVSAGVSRLRRDVAPEAPGLQARRNIPE